MPLYQVPQMAKGSHELDHFNMSNCAADLAYGPDDELVELLWENGQIVMQGQSNISRRNSSFTGSNSNPSKVQEKDLEGHVIPKIGRYGGSLECFENGLSSSGLIQEDDMVPWLRCPVGDSLQNEDCSEFVTAFAVNSMNSAAAHNSVVPTNSYGQEVKDTQRENPEQGNSYKITSGGSRLTGSRSNQLFASAQRPVANVRPEASRFVFNRNSSKEAPSRYSTQTLPVSSGPLPSATIQKKDSKLPQSNNNTRLMNFSHFSRPAALVKTNLESLHKLKCHDKMSKPVPGNNPIEQSVMESTSVKSVERDVGVPVSLTPMVYMSHMTDMRNKPNQVLASANQSEMFFQGDTSQNSINRSPEQILNRSSSFAVSVTLERPENEKFSEPEGASSSVCSRNSAGAASHDSKHELDRKNHEVEESDYPSYDADYESVQARKPTLRSGTSAKRSRAAEVHNLSERKRRDRINEKMRALQELIPNCNKVDKASMLDEAIEYLKTLQMQVQIMSMRTGLCMSPLILPARMPPIHRPHMAHLSPMNFGMGMSMRAGLGSSMIDMPGMSGSSGFPLMPGIQFPSSSISGPANFHMMSGSSLPMFGVHGHMMPVAPFIPFSSYTTKEVPLPDVQGASPAVSVPVPNSPFPPSSSKDAM